MGIPSALLRTALPMIAGFFITGETPVPQNAKGVRL